MEKHARSAITKRVMENKGSYKSIFGLCSRENNQAPERQGTIAVFEGGIVLGSQKTVELNVSSVSNHRRLPGHEKYSILQADFRKSSKVRSIRVLIHHDGGKDGVAFYDCCQRRKDGCLEGS